MVKNLFIRDVEEIYFAQKVREIFCEKVRKNMKLIMKWTKSQNFKSNESNQRLSVNGILIVSQSTGSICTSAKRF